MLKNHCWLVTNITVRKLIKIIVRVGEITVKLTNESLLLQNPKSSLIIILNHRLPVEKSLLER